MRRTAICWWRCRSGSNQASFCFLFEQQWGRAKHSWSTALSSTLLQLWKFFISLSDLSGLRVHCLCLCFSAENIIFSFPKWNYTEKFSLRRKLWLFFLILSGNKITFCFALLPVLRLQKGWTGWNWRLQCSLEDSKLSNAFSTQLVTRLLFASMGAKGSCWNVSQANQVNKQRFT